MKLFKQQIGAGISILPLLYVFLAPLPASAGPTSDEINIAVLGDFDSYLRGCYPIETVQALLDEHPTLPMNQPIAVEGLEKTPLTVAIRATAKTSCFMFSDLFGLLAAKGAQLNLPDANGNTPLTLAVVERNPTAIEYLAARAETTFQSYPSGRYPFQGDDFGNYGCPDCSLLEFTAAIGIDSSAFAALVKSGKVRLEDAGKDATTPLIAAAGYGNLPAVQALLAAGANAKAINANGYTAIKAVQMAAKNPDFSSILYENKNGAIDQLLHGFGPQTDRQTVALIIQALKTAGATE